MSTTSALMTVAEFRKLDDPIGGYLELHDGKPVFLSYPKHRHKELQRRLRRLLEEALGAEGIADTEFPYRPRPEHELRSADFAWVLQSRYDAIDPEDNLHGSPDVVAEVLSPSNTRRDISQKRELCMASGCREFWIVDARRSSIEISRPDSVVTLMVGDSVRIGQREYSLDKIFAS